MTRIPDKMVVTLVAGNIIGFCEKPFVLDKEW